MARKEDRQFSESESLQGLDDTWMQEEGDQRLPAWAGQMEADENAPPVRKRGSDRTQEELEQPGETGEEPRADQEDAQSDARARAEEAWAREAVRVESTQGPRRQTDEAGKAETKAKGKKNAGKKTADKKSGRKKKKKTQEDDRKSFLRSMTIVIVCAVLFVMVALMVVSNFVSHPLLALPRKMVTSIITPVQSIFSGVTDSVVDYLRKLKIRGNLEYEYDQLTILLDDYATQIAQNEELRRINDSLYDLLDEQERNRGMNPVAATVIGTDSGNYFSTLTLDVGSANGVQAYMAVVAQGGLVGVTYDVEPYKCQVRCIINSDCTVAALVQSSRDQGSVKGTLGVNGEPMCRMYYLPDNSLPRPGDTVVTSGVGLEFPKGIPIGTIRESTRGMEDNKSYVVLEPIVDFQHLEFVTVYRYKPTYAEAAQQRDNTSSTLTLEPLSTPRPIPTFQVGGLSDFLFSATATPAPEADETPAPTQTPGPTPGPTAGPGAEGTPLPDNLEYIPAELSGVTPTPSPRPTFTPTPSPVPTVDPGNMTVEDDE